jgi:hypothetical protein
MAESDRGTAFTGLALGALIALSFAIVISRLPATLFLETRWRIVVYIVCALAAPPTVWLLQWIARARRLDQRRLFTWATAGAMTFDGLAIGFASGLYGQTGQALAWTASALLFAFVTAIVAGQVMLGKVAPALGR